jgi:hypothetical protein
MNFLNRGMANMKWVTRHKIRVNRTATAWLIRRFIDPDAEFIFIEPEQVAETQQRLGAKGFDAPGATYPHKDVQGRCSFEALVEERCPNDPVLKAMAAMVRAADFKDELYTVPEAAGLQCISHGFPLVSKNDQETLDRAAYLYDALYASLQERQQRSS